METNRLHTSATPFTEPMQDQFIRDKKDRIFVYVALALGFLFCDFIFFEGLGVGVTAYMAVFYASVFWYMGKRKQTPGVKSLGLFVPILLLLACFTLYDNLPLSLLNFLLLAVLLLLHLAVTTGNRLYKTTAIGLLLDLFHTGVALPLCNIPAPFKAMKPDGTPTDRSKGIGKVLLGLLISVPLLLVVLTLLVSADAVFSKLLDGVMKFINNNVSEYILKLLFGAAFSIPLFGMLYALRRNKTIDGFRRNIRIDMARILDQRTAITVLVLLCAVYAAFIAIQFGYLFNAFSSILPQSFTYAEYARRGFFELMGVVFINLVVFTAAFLFTRRSAKAAGFKAMLSLLAISTLLLITSALAKMLMYVDAYGLTLLRVYTSWFMVLCACVFIALLLKVFWKKFPLVLACSMAFLVLYLGLNFADVDSRMAQYNIAQYTSGKSATVDMEAFYDLSDSIIPSIVPLLNDSKGKVTADAKLLLESKSRVLKDHRWQTFTLARQNAQQALIAAGIQYHPQPNDDPDN